MAAPTTLPALLSSLTQSLSSAQDITPTISSVTLQKDGISLLDVKNELLLSYLQNLVFLILLKLRNAKDESKSEDNSNLDESVRAKLVELRLYLEKGARPLEEKLRFSIDRFLRTADDAQRDEKSKSVQLRTNGKGQDSEEDDDEESASDDESQSSSDEAGDGGAQLSNKRNARFAAPNISSMKDDITARPSAAERSNGLYRPPRRTRQVMESIGRPKEQGSRRPQRSTTMDEFVTSELSAAPMAEPSVGTTIVQGGRKVKTAAQRQEEDERREYEESNFVRLPKESKKDKAKKAKIEGRSSKMMFGGEEFRELGEGVDRIDRLTKRGNSGKGGGVRAMLEKSRKRGMDTVDGPRGSGHGMQMGERFQKRVKTLEGGRRDRGKGR